MPAPPPFEDRYVVALPRSSGTRLFCTDELRDYWSGHLYDATKFPALHVAEQVAKRHGAITMQLRDALVLDGATPA